MRIFLLFMICIQGYECFFPFPIISNKTLYVIGDIGYNETFEIYFSKPTLVVNKDAYVYDNINNKKYLTTWQAEYYIIDSGLLYETSIISEDDKKPLQMMDINFLNTILLANSSYPKHVYVDENVKIKYKIWHTDHEQHNGDKYLSDAAKTFSNLSNFARSSKKNYRKNSFQR
ncbi:hypothetical protein Yalta_009 [Yalta virus]|nr:hypothetical protein Yalta_009 [Yalta virus]